MEGREPVFLSAPAAAIRVARDPQTIRRWANNGQVRRRARGRIVEYREDDLLAVAGLAELDEKDREIARLRVDLAQVRADHAAALEQSKKRQDKLNTFQSRAVAKYKEYEQYLQDFANQFEREQAAVQSWQAQYAAEQRRGVALEQQLKDAQARVAQLTTLQPRAARLFHEFEVLVDSQFTMLTKREQRDLFARLCAQVDQLARDGQ